MKCELCGSEKEVKQVGSKSYWCNKCITRGLEEAKEMNEIESKADEVEEWINKSKVKLLTTTVIQMRLRVGLIQANKIIAQLIERNVISFNESLRKYEVVGK